VTFALGVLVVTAVLVAGVGLAMRWRSGRVRASMAPDDRLPDVVLDHVPSDGQDVTLLQLSTTFCAPCRHARVLLEDLARRTPGVRHIEVDLTDRPELTQRLRVRSTPTTVAIDPVGRELLRLVGVPRRDALLSALRPHLRDR
jgi:thiol-disulfide isomerase/thioredoxin